MKRSWWDSDNTLACKIMNKLEGTGTLLLLTAVLSWFLLGSAAYCSRHALLPCVLLSQMAEEVVCTTHSVLIMMMSCFSWKIATEKEKKKIATFSAKNKHLSLKKFKKKPKSYRQFPATHIRLGGGMCNLIMQQSRWSNIWLKRFASLQTQALTVLLCMRSPHSPCSVSLPINTFKIDLWEQ